MDFGNCSLHTLVASHCIWVLVLDVIVDNNCYGTSQRDTDAHLNQVLQLQEPKGIQELEKSP